MYGLLKTFALAAGITKGFFWTRAPRTHYIADSRFDGAPGAAITIADLRPGDRVVVQRITATHCGIGLSASGLRLTGLDR